MGQAREQRAEEKSEIMSGLYFLALERLEKLKKSKEGIIRFPKVFEKLCTTFSINKKQAWEILFFLNDIGFIKIVPYQGIKFLKKL